MAYVQPAVSLLQLPDPCLVAVLRCCADDHRSVCSAARAHSRLHQAAVEALSSITAYLHHGQFDFDNQYIQDGLDNLMDVYLPNNGQHVDSISLEGREDDDQPCMMPCDLLQLPTTLTKLSSLKFKTMFLQLQQGDGFHGVLGAAAAFLLKQLRIHDCNLYEGGKGLSAALALLTGLEHLSISCSCDMFGRKLRLRLGAVLPVLQQLSYLELDDVLLGAEFGPNELQHLSALTRLADLRLKPICSFSFTPSMISGTQDLTHLQIGTYWDHAEFDPAVLAGRTLLQHLELQCRKLLGGATGVAQLLSQLQQLQQLTCLVLHGMVDATPAAAYSALTASSKLQHLDISRCCLPAGEWQHVFPAGRQLPHLHTLCVAEVQRAAVPAAAPEGTRLVSCCPGLQSLNMWGLQYNKGLLVPLQGLSSLTSLQLEPAAGSAEGLEGVCQLTGLQRLVVQLQPAAAAAEGLLLQLTQLQRLTYLGYGGSASDERFDTFEYQGEWDDPVWPKCCDAAPLWHQCHLTPNPESGTACSLALSEEQRVAAAQALRAESVPHVQLGAATCRLQVWQC